MKPTKTRRKIKFPSIFKTKEGKVNASMLLEKDCFGIPGGSYLLIDIDTPYINGMLSVVLLDGEFKLLRINSQDGETFLFTCGDYYEFIEKQELEERGKFVGVVLQALVSFSRPKKVEVFKSTSPLSPGETEAPINAQSKAI